MLAILPGIFPSPADLRIGEVETPQPGPQEVLIRVAATAANRADTLQRQGKYPPPPGASAVMGLEAAGVVAAVGELCRKHKVGDRVCALLPGGGYAQYVAIHEDIALPVPGSLSLEEAAAIPEVFLTAWQALVWLGKVQQKEKVLIHAGASGVGTAAIQLALQLGAQPYVTASPGKHALCLSLGALKAFDYKDPQLSETLAREMGGADLILDFIGGPNASTNLRLLNTDGRMVLLALMGGGKWPEADLTEVLRKRLHLMGSTLRSRDVDYKIRLSQEFAAFAWPLFVSGQLRPVIDSVLDWSEAGEAHRRMEANENAGKLILRVQAG
ncbi:MAG: NAD(P)H-quinone oxidoreductase [Bacteroidetes bacterium]|nr:MAG: NAD(P)H-quinone oxidoreductase [Bacteroidota bacterium]